MLQLQQAVRLSVSEFHVLQGKRAKGEREKSVSTFGKSERRVRGRYDGIPIEIRDVSSVSATKSGKRSINARKLTDKVKERRLAMAGEAFVATNGFHGNVINANTTRTVISGNKKHASVRMK